MSDVKTDVKQPTLQILHFKDFGDPSLGPDIRKCCRCGTRLWVVGDGVWTEELKAWENPPEGYVNCFVAKRDGVEAPPKPKLAVVPVRAPEPEHEAPRPIYPELAPAPSNEHSPDLPDADDLVLVSKLALVDLGNLLTNPEHKVVRGARTSEALHLLISILRSAKNASFLRVLAAQSMWPPVDPEDLRDREVEQVMRMLAGQTHTFRRELVAWGRRLKEAARDARRSVGGDFEWTAAAFTDVKEKLYALAGLAEHADADLRRVIFDEADDGAGGKVTPERYWTVIGLTTVDTGPGKRTIREACGWHVSARTPDEAEQKFKEHSMQNGHVIEVVAVYSGSGHVKLCKPVRSYTSHARSEDYG